MDRLLPQVHISVRSLVEFILRHGDIDDRHKASSGPEVMLEGANIHRAIQRSMGRQYHAEVFLGCIIRRPDCEIVVDGRADGIIIPEPFEEKTAGFIEDASSRLTVVELGEKDKLPDASLMPEEDAPENGPDLKGHVIIDEIKTTYRDLERIKRPEPEHLAQAKCYAFMFSDIAGLTDIGVRITYCNTETREVRYFDSLYTYEEISAWLRRS